MSPVIAEPPPLTAPPARPAAAKRVALGLVAFGVFDLVTTVAAVVAAVGAAANAEGNLHLNLNSLLSFLAYGVAAWMVWKDKRLIWPIMAFLAAGGLGLMLGALVGTLLQLPPGLLQALSVSAQAAFWSTIFPTVALCLFLMWILWESNRVDWGPAFRRPLRWWLRPATCMAIAALVGAGFFAGILALLQGSWTAEAVARARQIHGDNRSYVVLNYHVHSTNQLSTHTAEVLAYGPDGVERIPLRWQEER